MDRIVEDYFNAKVIAIAWPQVLDGFRTTVIVSLLVIVLGVSFGLMLALIRCANLRPLNFIIAIYVDVLRTLPQLIVMVFFYFGLPYLGLTMSPFVTTVLALGML